MKNGEENEEWRKKMKNRDERWRMEKKDEEWRLDRKGWRSKNGKTEE